MEEIHEYNHINKKRKLLLEKTNNNENAKTKKKSVKMYCPKAGKTAEVIAWEDQRLDIGSIARIFGIEPVTLKLNGHFISRGVDLIASSVTWKSLLNFFSYKGLSTGVDHSSALLVDGKLDNKCGSKRQHDPEVPEVHSKMNCVRLCEEEGARIDRTPHTEVINSASNKKLKGNSNVCEIENKTIRCSDTVLKRKSWLENIGPLIKRARIGEQCSNEFFQGLTEREGCVTKLRCSYDLHDKVKRMREDEVIAASCKRAR